MSAADIIETYSQSLSWSVGLLLLVLENRPAGRHVLVRHEDLVVPVEYEVPGGIFDGQAVRRDANLFHSDGGGSHRQHDDVMIAGREVSLVEGAINGLAGGVVAIADATFVALSGRAQLPIATERKANSIDADIIAQVVALGAVDDFLSPFIVEARGFGFARQLTLVLSGVGEPLNPITESLNNLNASP